MPNIQKIEEVADDLSGDFLDVQSIGKTIYGEGTYAGHRCIAVRLAGCNLQCPRCDSDYTSRRYTEAVESVVDHVTRLQRPPGFVVITGGEPLRQNLDKFISILQKKKYFVLLETNGSMCNTPAPRLRALVKEGLFIVCSPKTDKLNKTIEALVSEYRYIIDFASVDDDDGLPLSVLGHTVPHRVARPKGDAVVYVQPQDDSDAKDGKTTAEVVRTNARHLLAAVDSTKNFGYVLTLQLQKYIGIE